MHEKHKKEIEAYMDGELNKSQEKRFEETVNNFPILDQYRLKLEKQKILLKRWWELQKHH